MSTKSSFSYIIINDDVSIICCLYLHNVLLFVKSTCLARNTNIYNRMYFLFESKDGSVALGCPKYPKSSLRSPGFKSCASHNKGTNLLGK